MACQESLDTKVYNNRSPIRCDKVTLFHFRALPKIPPQSLPSLYQIRSLVTCTWSLCLLMILVWLSYDYRSLFFTVWFCFPETGFLLSTAYTLIGYPLIDMLARLEQFLGYSFCRS